MSESSQSLSPSPPPDMPLQHGPKRYRPPKADENTFETQAGFLDSLETVPLESVEHRRCPHCWKDYGESDPGLDNAEAPVRLLCNHVFGEKCLKDLFGLPEPVKIDLVSLSFEYGSRGEDLGRRLSVWVNHCGVDKGALLLGGNRKKDFEKLVSEMQNGPRQHATRSTDVAAKTIGSEWLSVFVQVLMPRNRVDSIHILENAIIFDIGSKTACATLEAHQKAPTAGINWPTGFPGDPTQSLFGNLPVAPDWDGQHLYDVAAQASSETSSNASPEFETEKNTPKGDGSASAASVTPPGVESQTAAYTAHAPNVSPDVQTKPSPAASPTDGKATAKPSGVAFGKNQAKEKKIKGKIQKVKSIFSPQKAKSAPAKADSTTTTSAADEDFAFKLKAEEEKLKSVLTFLDHPTLLAHLPPTIQNAMLTPETPFGANPVDYVKPSEAFMKMIAAEDNKAENISTPLQTIPGAWKDNIPETTNLDKLVALKKAQKKAVEAVEAAKAGKALHKKHQEAAAIRTAKMQEERNALAKHNAQRLVETLKTIYEEYEQFMYEQALAAGQPPPVKKLRLASSSVSPVASPVPTPPPTALPKMTLTNVISVSAVVHEVDLGAKGYKVPMPYVLAANPDISDDEDTDNASNDERRVFFLTRTRCTKCATSDTTLDFYELPEYITWTDIKNVPDGCPICQKVLFKKTGENMGWREDY